MKAFWRSLCSELLQLGKKIIKAEEGEDTHYSALIDALVFYIFSLLDMKTVVETCILRKRQNHTTDQKHNFW